MITRRGGHPFLCSKSFLESRDYVEKKVLVK